MRYYVYSDSLGVFTSRHKHKKCAIFDADDRGNRSQYHAYRVYLVPKDKRYCLMSVLTSYELDDCEEIFKN